MGPSAPPRRLSASPRSFATLAGWTLVLGLAMAASAGAETASEPIDARDAVLPGSPPSDPAAVALAEQVLVNLGGREAWNATRYLKWRFMGRRLHHWDRFRGDVRIESEDLLVLMNLRSLEGRAFVAGEEIVDPDARAEALERGYSWWVNDSYWLIMPAKLLDPGVRLQDGGPAPLEDGRPARRLTVTFDADIGLTPKNRYDVWVADETGLVEQWAYYGDAADPEPRFVGPWAGWQTFGEPPIRIATSRGRGHDWEIEVPAGLPGELFERP